MLAALLEAIASIFGAVFSGRRRKNQQQEQQEHVVEAYRDEAKGMAKPDQPWADTVDRL